MALSPTTVATAIAGLSVAGVSIKDLDGIKQMVLPRDCPVVYPDPKQPLSELTVSRESAGPDGSAFKEVRYTLNYVFLYKQVGEGRGLYTVAQGLVTAVCAFLDALVANGSLNGCIDDVPENVELGIVLDPADEEFFGARIPVRIVEYING